MTLQQLRAFLAVVEHGSFRAAARALSVSQAGLTQRVQELEATLGRALLLRSARGASLTDAGLRLRERALLIDAEARLALEDAPTGGGHDEGTLRIGVGPTPTALLLPRVVPGERLRRIQWVGLVIAFAAVAMAFGEGFMHGSPVAGAWLGDAWRSTSSVSTTTQSTPHRGRIWLNIRWVPP